MDSSSGQLWFDLAFREYLERFEELDDRVLLLDGEPVQNTRDPE